MIKKYNKLTSLKKVAESWELSTHPDGKSMIDDMPLSESISKHPELLGTKSNGLDIPILIKLIDAKQNLSVQVHPDDLYAKSIGQKNGKTEMWLVLDHGINASIFLGFKNDIDKNNISSFIDDGSITKVLNRIQVKKGDVFFIKPGTVHAICRDVVILEVQQSSNITYRLYDYNRLDNKGMKRELHLKEALEVLNFSAYMEQTLTNIKVNQNSNFECGLLVECKYFKVYKYTVKTEVVINITTDSFASIVFIERNAKLKYLDIVTEYKKGDTIFIPAQNTEINISGQCEFVLVTL